ncbi:MAG: hypothetical protein ACE5GZ_06505 [Gammaproteobacteria bacterium]
MNEPGISVYLKRVLPMLLRSLPGAAIKAIGLHRDHLHRVKAFRPK